MAHMKRWLQATYKISLTLRALFAAFVPDKELKDLFNTLEDYIKKK